jgi:hypothetical protein
MQKVLFALYAAVSMRLDSDTFKPDSLSCEKVVEKCQSVWESCFSSDKCCGLAAGQLDRFLDGKKLTNCGCNVYEAFTENELFDLPKRDLFETSANKTSFFSVRGQDAKNVSFLEQIAYFTPEIISRIQKKEPLEGIWRLVQNGGPFSLGHAAEIKCGADVQDRSISEQEL